MKAICTLDFDLYDAIDTTPIEFPIALESIILEGEQPIVPPKPNEGDQSSTKSKESDKQDEPPKPLTNKQQSANMKNDSDKDTNKKFSIREVFDKVVKWVRNIIEKISDVFKSIKYRSGAETIVLQDKSDIEPVFRLNSNQNDALDVISKCSELLAKYKVLATSNSDQSSALNEVSGLINNLNARLNDYTKVDSYPATFKFNSGAMLQISGKIIDKLNETGTNLQNLNTIVRDKTDQSSDVVTSSRAVFTIIQKSMSTIHNDIMKVLIIMKANISGASNADKVKGLEADILNGKIANKMDGFNIINIERKRFPFTYFVGNNTDPKIIQKYGKIFICQNKEIISKFSGKERSFILNHELNHAHDYESGDYSKLGTMEKEYKSDKYAMNKCNMTVNEIQKLFDKIIEICNSSGITDTTGLRSSLNVRINHLKSNS